MQETGDDFLAGARLAEQQHCRIGGGYLTGEREDLSPARRLADDAMKAVAGVELVGQRLHARLETRCPLGGFVGALDSIEAALARQAQRDAVRHTARARHIVYREGARRA